jgi:hypothetical protein
MMLYASPYLRDNNTLPKSGTIVKTWMIKLFLVSQVVIVTYLATFVAQIHLSFDL